jgi:hypothetical protein
MIFKRESFNSYRDRITTWHDWFAWHSVVIENDNYRVWLQIIERAADYGTLGDGYGGPIWKYRIKKSK